MMFINKSRKKERTGARTSTLIGAVVGAFFLPHCAASDDPSVLPLVADGPSVVDEQLVWVNHTTSQIVVLDPHTIRSPTVIALDQAIATTTFGPHEVLALGRSNDDDEPVLDVVRFPALGRARIELFARFNRLIVSKNGHSAILIHDLHSAGDMPVAAQNQNEIAVVDLINGTARRVLLDTESATPRNVIFSPQDEHAAVVLDGAIVLVGLGANTSRIKVPLKLPGGGQLLPEHVEFAPDGRHLLITVNGTTEVIVMNIYNPDETLDGSLNFISVPGAGRLLEIALPPSERYDGHIAALFRRANGGGTIAAVFDVNGDASAIPPLETSDKASKIAFLGNGMLLIHGAPVVWGWNAVSGGTDYVAGWNAASGQSDEDQLAGPTLGPPVLGQDAAFFLHNENFAAGGGSAGGVGTTVATTLTRVSLETSTARIAVELRPLVLGGVVKDYTADPERGGILLGIDIPRANSGAAPPLVEDEENADGEGYSQSLYTVYPSNAWIRDRTGALTRVDASDLSIETLILDDPIDRVGIVGAYIFATHAGALGDVTIVPSTHFDRTHAVRYDGVLLAGLLSANEVTP
ncbi:MAG: hypothetical protein H6729_11525 [Deltaproteobacteria bacterium]|nr:hypothetical protein [Deltaproteobacteria bacterium]